MSNFYIYNFSNIFNVYFIVLNLFSEWDQADINSFKDTIIFLDRKNNEMN